MKVAKVFTQKVFGFTCPDCERDIEEPSSGSLNWNQYDVQNAIRANETAGHGRVIVCGHCGASLKVPASVLK